MASTSHHDPKTPKELAPTDLVCPKPKTDFVSTPDRFAAQGIPQEMVNLYTQKAQDIQAASTLVKKARGK